MIVQHSNGVVLECDICGEVDTIARAAASQPELRMLAVEAMDADHKPCEQYKDDLPRAKRERGFIRRMRKQQRLLNEQRRRGVRG